MFSAFSCVNSIIKNNSRVKKTGTSTIQIIPQSDTYTNGTNPIISAMALSPDGINIAFLVNQNSNFNTGDITMTNSPKYNTIHIYKTTDLTKPYAILNNPYINNVGNCGYSGNLIISNGTNPNLYYSPSNNVATSNYYSYNIQKMTTYSNTTNNFVTLYDTNHASITSLYGSSASMSADGVYLYFTKRGTKDNILYRYDITSTPIGNSYYNATQQFTVVSTSVAQLNFQDTMLCCDKLLGGSHNYVAVSGGSYNGSGNNVITDGSLFYYSTQRGNNGFNAYKSSKIASNQTLKQVGQPNLQLSPDGTIAVLNFLDTVDWVIWVIYNYSSSPTEVYIRTDNSSNTNSGFYFFDYSYRDFKSYTITQFNGKYYLYIGQSAVVTSSPYYCMVYMVDITQSNFNGADNNKLLFTNSKVTKLLTNNKTTDNLRYTMSLTPTKKKNETNFL